MASASTAPVSEPDHEHGVKRRQSEELEDTADSKRQRTSPGKNSPTATRDNAEDQKDNKDTPVEEQKASSPGDTRRKSSTVDEKGRSKRLFGALLGNLRQPGDRTSKRRQEIESRRKAELQRQDDERLEDRQRRQEQLAEQRKITQVKVDEQNMHRRHRAMLDKANFLQTETEPVLFYRPWDLRDDEEDRIDDQIKEAEDHVDKEVAESHQRHSQKSPRSAGEETTEADTKDEKPRLEGDAKASQEATSPAGENATAQDEASAKSTAADAPQQAPNTDIDATNNREDVKVEERPASKGEGGEGGDDGENIQEGDEDAVIY